jgi:hypothetical protein
MPVIETSFTNEWWKSGVLPRGRNSILQQLKIILRKIADVLFRISSTVINKLWAAELRESQNCHDNKTLIFFFAFPVLSGKFGQQSWRFRATKLSFLVLIFFVTRTKSIVSFEPLGTILCFPERSQSGNYNFPLSKPKIVARIKKLWFSFLRFCVGLTWSNLWWCPFLGGDPWSRILAQSLPNFVSHTLGLTTLPDLL